MNGDWKCLFRAPKLRFERKPGGRIWISERAGRDGVRNCVDKMRMWGYFVEEGRGNIEGGREKRSAFSEKECEGVKVLWVGRLLKLKRVDTIIRAVGESAKSKKITLDIYGLGPEEAKLKKLAAKYDDIIRFYPPVPITEVRNLMRVHDIYVLSSNAYEGWGAVVSEALEEGMRVIGTYEAGSSATILPESNLFHAGDWRRLKELLEGDVEKVGIGEWTAKVAARVLLENS
jgi:glycosyltransferase involved in cell wall biosynthesis